MHIQKQHYIKRTTYHSLRHNLIAIRRVGAPWPGWPLAMERTRAIFDWSYISATTADLGKDW